MGNRKTFGRTLALIHTRLCVCGDKSQVCKRKQVIMAEFCPRGERRQAHAISGLLGNPLTSPALSCPFARVLPPT